MLRPPVSNSEKYSVYIVAKVALEHSPGISRNKTNTLTYFSARDFSFSLLDKEKTIKILESTKGKEVLDQVLYNKLWNRWFHCLQRSVIGIRLWGGYQGMKERAIIVRTWAVSFCLSLIILWWAQHLYFLQGRTYIAEPHKHLHITLKVHVMAQYSFHNRELLSYILIRLWITYLLLC